MGLRKVLMTGLALICSLGLVHSVFAFTWTEVGDAGDLLATAQIPVGEGPLTSISGMLTLVFNSDSGSPIDADMYRIFIADPLAFSATTVGLTSLDTQLFLFTQFGMGVYANDDCTPGLVGCPLSGDVVQSTLPPGLPSGFGSDIYYLVVTSFDLDPVSLGGPIFPNDPTNQVYGPTGPGGGFAITEYSGFGTTGAYTIALTGVDDVPVPEPATLLLLGSGVAGVAWATRNRQRRK